MRAYEIWAAVVWVCLFLSFAVAETRWAPVLVVATFVFAVGMMWAWIREER